jgi:hypothetical protein
VLLEGTFFPKSLQFASQWTALLLARQSLTFQKTWAERAQIPEQRAENDCPDDDECQAMLEDELPKFHLHWHKVIDAWLAAFGVRVSCSLAPNV